MGRAGAAAAPGSSTALILTSYLPSGISTPSSPTPSSQLTLYQDVLEMPMAMYRWAERKYVPYMATEWGFEPPDVFKVTLREGAKWSDGSEFTSKDVVTTFNILRLQEQLAWNYLASVEPEDDYNLTFKMKDPSTVVERLVLRERIRANSVYGEWSEQAQELFDSGADPESKEYRDVVTKFEEFRPEQMVVSGPFNIDKKSYNRVAADHGQGRHRLERRPHQLRQDDHLQR